MSEKWKTRYPHVAQSIDAVASIVAQLRQNPEAELEGRFGFMIKNRFVAGVQRSDIDKIIDMMQHSQHVVGDDEWTEEQDFFFVADDHKACRTRVTYDSSTMSLKSHTIEKVVVDNATFGIKRSAGDDAVHAVRVSLKTETPLLRLQPCVSTINVRIKQKRRFVTRCGLWSFDFAMIWSGETKTAAEEKQSTSDPIFEVECELVNPCKALSLHDDARIATSLLLKLTDLIDDGDCTIYRLE